MADLASQQVDKILKQREENKEKLTRLKELKARLELHQKKLSVIVEAHEKMNATSENLKNEIDQLNTTQDGLNAKLSATEVSTHSAIKNYVEKEDGIKIRLNAKNLDAQQHKTLASDINDLASEAQKIETQQAEISNVKNEIEKNSKQIENKNNQRIQLAKDMRKLSFRLELVSVEDD